MVNTNMKGESKMDSENNNQQREVDSFFSKLIDEGNMEWDSVKNYFSDWVRQKIKELFPDMDYELSSSDPQNSSQPSSESSQSSSQSDQSSSSSSSSQSDSTDSEDDDNGSDSKESTNSDDKIDGEQTDEHEHKGPKTPKFKLEIEQNDIPENWWDMLPDFDPRVYDAMMMKQAAACVEEVIPTDVHELQNKMEARKFRKTDKIQTQIPRTQVIPPKEITYDIKIDSFIKDNVAY